MFSLNMVRNVKSLIGSAVLSSIMSITCVYNFCDSKLIHVTFNRDNFFVFFTFFLNNWILL